MIGWKVVTKDGGSVFAMGRAHISYSTSWTRAPKYLERAGYYPTYFSTRLCAEAYQKGLFMGSTLKVVKVQARGVLRKLPPILRFHHFEGGKVDRRDAARSTSSWPTGTKMAREIRIVEEK